MSENSIIHEEQQAHQGRTWRVCTWNHGGVSAYWNWSSDKYDPGDIRSMMSIHTNKCKVTVAVVLNQRPGGTYTIQRDCTSLETGIQWAGDVIGKLEQHRNSWGQKLSELAEIWALLEDQMSQKRSWDDKVGKLQVELTELTKHQQSALIRVGFLGSKIDDTFGLSPECRAPSPEPLADAAE